MDRIRKIIDSRKKLVSDVRSLQRWKSAEEGGCGVVGFTCSEPVGGRHIFEPSIQMHNRGNGKGGGIAAASLDHEQLGVSEDVLKNDYMIQIALTDPGASGEVEENYITPNFNVDHKTEVEPAADWKELGMPIQPPDIVRYFVRVKEDVLGKFAEENGLGDPDRGAEDEFVYQNSAKLNLDYYAALGEKRAFVLSHARNLAIFKVVGYAEHVVQYYGLENMTARIWIAHQRYPTKGRVWHPAGSHPFIGMNEALVHNGDFANYYSVAEYLRQHNIEPQFLTDTEVSVQLFDLWRRTFKYPLEYCIEAMAPTTEHDFDSLTPERQKVYRALQSMHVGGSPDGPWFFIIACSNPDADRYRLLGITDTAMLRPQVFAVQEGDVSIGLVGSEKQAIDATLHSLHEEDSRFRLVADRYWNARGGSHTDGGAFTFALTRENGNYALNCFDKFGAKISAPSGEYKIEGDPEAPAGGDELIKNIEADLSDGDAVSALTRIMEGMKEYKLANVAWICDKCVDLSEKGGDIRDGVIHLLTLLNDRRYSTGSMKRSAVLQIVRGGLDKIFDAVPLITSEAATKYKRIDWESREKLRPPRLGESVLVIHAPDFPPEGDHCDSQYAVKAFNEGWKRFIVYGLKGQRFHGCGMGPGTGDVRFDLYGASGDYLASGIDGMEIQVHDNGQDQLGQILKQGTVVIHGDVGQTFLYGAKGGNVFVLGNAAGRPLINAVGRPKVVINGTSLDFLAESFMAGDPHKGGGFVILNGMTFDDQGRLVEQVTPYPGSNLFSLASGGAIFVRDPHKKLVDEQLNGGEYVELSDADWRLMLPLLRENEQHFGIKIDELLTVDGAKREPAEVYRKVRPVKMDVLAKQAVPE